MSDKKKKVYVTIVDGATDGLSSDSLFAFVKEKHPRASSKKIVRAALLALSDSDLRDRNILNTIYAMALKHRLDGIDASGDEDDDADGQSTEPFAPVPSAASVI